MKALALLCCIGNTCNIAASVQRYRHRDDIFPIGFEEGCPVFAELIAEILRFCPGHHNCPKGELN
jgi:hypothetical protein